MDIHKKASAIDLNKFVNIAVRNLQMYIVFIYIYMHMHLFSTFMYQVSDLHFIYIFAFT